MTPESIGARLRTRAIGRRIVCVETCESTNDLAWKAAVAGEPHGTAFFAEEQTKGRGRRGRNWVAPRGSAVLCSIVLRPDLDADRSQLVTVLGALAVADVAARWHVEARVRFPNDVVVRDRKLAGVLAEARFVSMRPDLFVLGIGLNVNAAPPDLPATSLAAEAGRELGVAVVARELLEAVDEWAARLEGPVDPFRAAWRERSDLVGRRVRLSEEGRSFSGTVVDVDCLDGIELRLDTGHGRHFRAERLERLETE